jgi:hypothetical protein
MNPTKFLADLEKEPFSDETKTTVKSIIGDAPELTPELLMLITEVLQDDVERDLAGIPVDSDEVLKIQQELEQGLLAIEQEASADEAVMEEEVQELADLSKKVDILERLHA